VAVAFYVVLGLLYRPSALGYRFQALWPSSDPFRRTARGVWERKEVPPGIVLSGPVRPAPL
jgi:hypothetical protein